MVRRRDLAWDSMIGFFVVEAACVWEGRLEIGAESGGVNVIQREKDRAVDKNQARRSTHKEIVQQTKKNMETCRNEKEHTLREGRKNA